MILSLDAARIRLSTRSTVSGRRYSDAVLRHAKEILAAPLLELEHEDGRDVILPTSRKLVDRVATLAVVDCLEGGSRHRKRAIGELLNAAAFPDWNPSHFLDTAEMTTGMALGLSWTSAILSRSERDTVANAIAAKGLHPGLEAAAAGAPWMTAANNWNIVCCAGMIAGAAAMQRFDPALSTAALGCFVPAIRCGLSAFGDDGSYTEGPDYWEYAVRYAVLAQAILTDIGIAQEVPTALLRTWRYARDLTGPSGRAFNFGDATERPRRAPVLGWLAQTSGETDAAAWQHASPGDPHPFDLVWCAPDAEPTNSDDTLTAYEPAGIAVLRRGATWLALKGGRNDTNHAHLDLGTFVLEMGGQRFVSELGRENYALPGYFDWQRRFGYFRTQTAGHSAVLIDGAQQSTAAFAEGLGTGRDGASSLAAYKICDGEHSSTWRRGISLHGENAVFIIDELEASSDTASPATWQVYTEAVVGLYGHRATLTLQGVTVEAEILEPAGLVWSFELARSPDGESSNAAFGRLFFDIPIPAETPHLTVRFAMAGTDGLVCARPTTAIADWPLAP